MKQMPETPGNAPRGFDSFLEVFARSLSKRPQDAKELIRKFEESTGFKVVESIPGPPSFLGRSGSLSVGLYPHEGAITITALPSPTFETDPAVREIIDSIGSDVQRAMLDNTLSVEQGVTLQKKAEEFLVARRSELERWSSKYQDPSFRERIVRELPKLAHAPDSFFYVRELVREDQRKHLDRVTQLALHRDDRSLEKALAEEDEKKKDAVSGAGRLVTGNSWMASIHPTHIDWRPMPTTSTWRSQEQQKAADDLRKVVDSFLGRARALAASGGGTTHFKALLKELIETCPSLQALRLPSAAVPAQDKQGINPDASYCHEIGRGTLIAKPVTVEGIPWFWIEYYSNAQMEAMTAPTATAQDKVVQPSSSRATKPGLFDSLRRLLGGGK